MYFKRWNGLSHFQKSDGPHWLKWVHHSEGSSHCQECLMLDGCLFLEGKVPLCPHHPNCHCILEPVDYAIVSLIASVDSDYGKYDPYLFNTQGRHPHGKDKLFREWGYTVADAQWLQAEMERQARENTSREIIY